MLLSFLYIQPIPKQILITAAGHDRLYPEGKAVAQSGETRGIRQEIPQGHDARKTLIGDVRGEGLMMAVELLRDRKTKKPAPEEIERVEAECFRNGLVVIGCGYSTIRLIPPLVIEKDELERGLEIFAGCLR
jgi:4-aminobutyrate aminotransferase-like enzyme